MPCWRIVFSTFCGCMSFYTTRVRSGHRPSPSQCPLETTPRKRTTRRPQASLLLMQAPPAAPREAQDWRGLGSRRAVAPRPKRPASSVVWLAARTFRVRARRVPGEVWRDLCRPVGRHGRGDGQASRDGSGQVGARAAQRQYQPAQLRFGNVTGA
jgi:hypothetical protein